MGVINKTHKFNISLFSPCIIVFFKFSTYNLQELYFLPKYKAIKEKISIYIKTINIKGNQAVM